VTEGGRLIAFRAPGRRRLHEDVAEQLRDAILDGRLRAGEKLPPERELAEQFAVNRTSVREAIKVLEGLGLVQVRQGDGATVQPVLEGSLEILGSMVFRGGRVDDAFLRELMEVVQPMLLEMGRLAIERARPANVRMIAALRDGVADETRDREERFAALHDILTVLADMTGNRVWQMLARRTRALLASEPLRAVRARLRRDPGRLVPLIDRCLDTLNGGDPVEATEALGTLIQRMRAEADPHGRRLRRADT